MSLPDLAILAGGYFAVIVFGAPIVVAAFVCMKYAGDTEESISDEDVFKLAEVKALEEYNKTYGGK